MNPRALLCDILNLSQDEATPIIAGERDSHPEVARALAAIARFDAAVRTETVGQMWGKPA